MDLLRPVRAFDRLQQRHRFLAIPMAVIKKFSDDGAGGLAALIAYYGFLSVFPLLLVFVTVLGYVFQGDPGLQHSISNSVLGRFPIIGPGVQNKQLSGHVTGLVIGVVVSLWAGLGVTNAAQNAFDQAWAIPHKERADFLKRRLRGLALVALLGLLFIVSSAASGLVTGGLGGPALKVAGIAVSLLINLALFATAFRVLTVRSVPTRSLWMGVVIGGVLWEILQVAGGIYVGHVIRRASNTYGTFATVIGLLAWLHLGAQATIYAAETNVVLERKLWPRSLVGPPIARADEETLAALAKVEERSDHEQIEVEFNPPPSDERPSGDQDGPGTDAPRRAGQPPGA
ncbi:MAG TPA: YihY/virulence factor BrkB family protein [Solirubrobacteraceae bacterium]